MSEAPKAFKSVIRKARKSHKCCECRKDILKGEKYRYESGIWDEPNSFKLCLNCHSIMTSVISSEEYSFSDGVAYGDLTDWFFNYLDNHYETAQSFIEDMSQVFGCEKEKLTIMLMPSLNKHADFKQRNHR